MYKIKTYNKISKIGLSVFDDKYTIGDEVENADGAIVRSAALHDVEFPKDLKAIARAGAGTNNIPIERCSEQGIVVFNTPGANANAVKELVLAGLLISSRRVISAIEWAKTLKGDGDAVGKEVEKGKSAFAGPEIKGKTLGVIGLGAIGVLVANAANSLGMTVYGYDPYLSVKSAWNLTHNAIHIDDIKELYQKCDYITVHVPLTDSTKNTINAESIAMMKDGVRILNFARNGLCDEDAVIAGLESGKVACYVTDFASEKLLAQPKAICLPHLGASTPESEDNCARMAAEELIEYLETGTIRNSVNFPNLRVPREANIRICIMHRNMPNLIARLSTTLSDRGINIENMGSRPRDEIAYTIMETNNELTPETKAALQAVEGVISFRVIE